MEDCGYCNVSDSEKIFEDDISIIAFHPKPAVPGHLLVIPKQHFTIFEQVPDDVAGHLFSVANNALTAIFEKTRASGTNLIVENGTAAGQKTAHFTINVLPRTENDGLEFDWDTADTTEEQLSSVELRIKNEHENPGDFEAKKEPIRVDYKKEIIPDSEEDYKLKQLRRFP